MQSCTDSKDTFHEAICPESAFVFGNPHEFGTSNGMFHTHPYSGNPPVILLFFFGKFTSLFLLDGLYDCHPFRGISLISGVLIQGAWYWEGVHRVRQPFIMRLSGNGLTDKENEAGEGYDNRILYRVAFLFPTIPFFLFLVIRRTGNLPLGPIMQKYGWDTFLGKFGQTFGKFLVGLGRYKPHRFKPETKDVCQTVDEHVAMLLIHIETGGMILLQRVVLQIHEDEEKTVCHCRKRTVPVNTKTATTNATFAAHLLLGQIIIMGSFKIWKQAGELDRAQACQGTKTFRIIFMLAIIHNANIRTCAIYNKSNLHQL